MKTLIKQALQRLARAGLSPMVDELHRDLQLDLAAPEDQLILMNQWRQYAREGGTVLSFKDVGFKRYSQFEEDGILLYIFSLISPTSRICLEMCAGNGKECCTTNLIVNHGWWGTLFDGNEQNVKTGQKFFASHESTFLCPPQFKHAWITAENVNDLLEQQGLTGEIDLLSLDIDGVDYWVWKAIEVVKPRVVVCETHNLIPPEMALTVPYSADFIAPSENYRGASLAAMAKLGAEKGYRLVGTHRYGFNAFFVQKGLAEDLLPETSVESCLTDPFTQHAQEQRWPEVAKLEWCEV